MLKNNGTPLLFSGIFFFSAVVGFLSGTNNSSVLSASLFAAITAIAGVIALIQKLYVPSGASAAAIEGSATFSTEQANTLGLVLVLLSIGYGAGLGAGICVHTSHPWLLGDKVRVPIPWESSTAPGTASIPTDIKLAVGWIALAERLRQTGMSDDGVRDMFAKFRDDVSAKEIVSKLGTKWLEGGAGAPTIPPSTMPPPATLTTPPPKS
jgi:hypothetical protein